MKWMPYVTVWLYLASVPLFIWAPEYAKYAMYPATALFVSTGLLVLLGYDPPADE